VSMRLFCLPYAGGSARVFAGWADGLPAAVEVCPLELPGRGLRFHEEPADRLEPVVADLIGAVLSRAELPFAVLGYSYGALLGFELARRLERYHGLRAEHLVVAAMRAPTWPRPEDPVSALSDAQFRRRLAVLGGTPPEVLANDALMEIMIPILRADFTVVDTYRYQGAAPLTCPVTTFGGLDDDTVPCAALDAWRHCTTGPFARHTLPGGHFLLRTAQDELLARLGAALDTVTLTTTGRGTR